MDMYRNLLQKDRVKFFALVLKNHEEKNAKGKNPDNSIDFESQIFSANNFQIRPQKKSETQYTERKQA